ncbi:MAG: GNAT family N-acetyltransferase [Planctomycetota bacterium]|jgi:ribosomal protein S18 acetylase RimI-like enzyme
MTLRVGHLSLRSTREDPVHWYATELPVEPFALKNKGMRMITMDSEEGFGMFVRTHTKSRGDRAVEETFERYRLEIEEGVIDRDKMITVLQHDHPLGCLSYEVLVKPDGFKYVLLHNLGVDPDHRGRGFGEEIIKIVLNMLIDDFGGGLTVMADIRSGDTASGHILRKSGFVPVEPEDWFPFPPDH